MTPSGGPTVALAHTGPGWPATWAGALAQLPRSSMRPMWLSAPALPPTPPPSPALTLRSSWPVAPLNSEMIPAPPRLPWNCITTKSSRPSALASPIEMLELPKPPLAVGIGESMRCT